jgi:hypothetical protein
MATIEQTIKNQYAKFFTQDDWCTFKTIADYYLETAAHLRTKDVKTGTSFKLLARNIQKRLFLGIGTELLIKAFYLKSGYGINKPNNGRDIIYRSSTVNPYDYKPADTYTLNFLIQEMENGRVTEFTKDAQILKGFKVAKVFRNKEGHVAVYFHKFDHGNYSDIEQAAISFYRLYFNQELDFRISMERNEKSIFAVKELG